MQARSPGPQPPRDASFRSSALVHALALFALLATGAWIASPLSGEGFKFYVDNPVHLVELESLAHGEAWSEIALCGLPLGFLHSPLWYGLLARMVASGLSAEIVYFAAIYVAFVAPSLAIYTVGRRRSSPGRALVCAYLVLILPASTFGMGSALAGMWTFHIGIAFLVFYADSLCTPQRALHERYRSALWLAMIALSHHFVLVAAVILSFVALGLRASEQRGGEAGRTLLLEVPVWMVGALASMAYWAPMLTTFEPGVAGTQDLPLYKLGLRLFLPTDIMRILATSDEDMIRTELYLSETFVHLALIALAVQSARARRRDRQRPGRAASLHLLGLAYSLTFLVILVVSSYVNLAFLGPLSWRYVAFVHLGLALAATGRPAGASARSQIPRMRLMLLAALIMIASGSWWSRPLSRFSSIPDSEEVRALERSWAWVAEHPIRGDGRPPRVYVQNAFSSFFEGALDGNHATIMAWRRTGRPQIGSFYGVHPFPTGLWTKSGWGALFGSIELSPDRLTARAGRSNTATIILSYPHWREFMSRVPQYEEVYRDGRFSIWQRKGPPPGWALPANKDALRVVSAHYEGQVLDIEVEALEAPATVQTAVAHHAWWRLEGPGELVEDKGGLMVVHELPAGRHRLRLSWTPPLWPRVGSVVGWLLLIGWGFASRRRRSKSVV